MTPGPVKHYCPVDGLPFDTVHTARVECQKCGRSFDRIKYSYAGDSITTDP